MLEDMSTLELMRRWDCSRQAVSQIMKRYGKEKMHNTGYNSCSIFRGTDILDVESNRQDGCRP